MPPRISETEAVALVATSPLLDAEWYAAQAGRAFGSRVKAAEHWVRERPEGASPHPLFEPAWLYPRGRWARRAPDPLSFWLADDAERQRSPHPLVDLDVTGPLEDWLAEHDPAELLRTPLERDHSSPVTVVVDVHDLPRAVHWARHLARTPDVGGRLVTTDAAATRILTAVTAGLPTVHVVAEAEQHGPGPATVHVHGRVRPPRWPWVEDLVAALDADGVGAAVPLLLHPDHSVAGPVLVGQPVADVERAAHLPLPPNVDPPVRATRGRPGATVLVTTSRLVTGADLPEGADEAWWRAAGFAAPGRPLTVREGRRALRWSIDIAAPATPRGQRWGDWHFARSLAAALERQGQWVAIDHPETRGRASRDLDDVTLVLRGLDRVTPPARTANLLWVISHPELVTPAELATYDAAFAASATWAARHGIEPLLQCTDPTRFHPDVARREGPPALFVGNSRGELRASVAAAERTGLDLTVIGQGWPGHVPVAADHVANDELGSCYASAGIVLNDHWADMREQGFVSNRVFDVLATGARLLSDDVAGLADALGEAAGAVRVWRTDEEFRALTTGDPDELWPDAAARRRTAERVVAEHSFDARAATLLARASALVDSRP
ncbi:hypothetical protein GGQ22_14950 [Nocardioides sp. zg-579]|uniref:Spore protein YkvP/CgeB glycosyl transferase-like domain-containing protein n=1 Tax=Nocardioides marmotae TaxID=2663857 RepID=A0A6I3JE97_9ACTN|nr:glycosyltransferase [Nocardioides marmotae]MCR6032723.1 hypothetical protein [Gordonia jinghuaiqii]MTB96373.1 hypothetical protein [Nocardioides marmotae]QKE03148.1 hypothetical protein HPC71_20345 [Nocardioides marmotae]